VEALRAVYAQADSSDAGELEASIEAALAALRGELQA
jgi:hypothetical protein